MGGGLKEGEYRERDEQEEEGKVNGGGLRRGEDERAVDLDLGKDGLAQIAKRRIAGAEIVERNAKADRRQKVQRRQRIGVFREEHALGDLHLKPRRRKPVLAERREDHRRQVRIGELQDRKSTRLNSSH